MEVNWQAPLHIEDYERGHIWITRSGYSKSGYVATTDDHSQYGELLAVVDGEDACAAYLFKKAWLAESLTNREYLLAIFPDLATRIDSGDTKGLYLTSLYKYAFKRQRELGYVRPCPRCGGSGHYSFNNRDGTRCFSCGGRKTVLQRVTKKLIAQIKKDQQAGNSITGAVAAPLKH